MSKRDRQFINTVVTFYEQYGRHHLPWRQTHDPYRVVISEVMLQQTQVDRVIPKYQSFLKQFPNTKRLAEASLADVLTAWQGLGYNRRAKLLKTTAAVVHETYRGRWPRSYVDLQSLPGIGPYTAGAVLAFAYNQAVPLIETNVRSVYLHHFYADEKDVTDTAILALISKHLPYVGDARRWYAALMDYGSHLKKVHRHLNHRALSYSRQSTFKGSDREVRGAIIRALTIAPATLPKLLCRLNTLDPIKIETQLERLRVEGMIEKTAHTYHLPQ